MQEDDLTIQEASPSELALIASAMNLFSIQDEASVTVTQLIKTAGISRSLFYRHFASKEDVYAAILLRDELALSSKMVDFKEIDSAGELLSEFLRFRVQQIKRYRLLFRLEKHLTDHESDLPRFRQWQALRSVHLETFSTLLNERLSSNSPINYPEQAQYYYGLIWSLATGVAQLSETDFFQELIQDRRGFNRFLLDALVKIGGSHD